MTKSNFSRRASTMACICGWLSISEGFGGGVPAGRKVRFISFSSCNASSSVHWLDSTLETPFTL